MMRRLGLIAYGAGILAFTVIALPSVTNIFAFLFDRPETAEGIIWLIYWIFGTFGPIILSIFVWHIAYRRRAHWLPHLLFIPLAILICIGGIFLFKQSVGVPIDDLREADAVVLGLGYLLISTFVHATAIAVAGVMTIKRWANGS